jgi:hypothetical protein
MNEQNVTAEGLRAGHERGIEIESRFSDLCGDFRMRSKIPIDFWRLLIRNGIRPKKIEVKNQVYRLCNVYGVCKKPLIIFQENAGRGIMFYHDASKVFSLAFNRTYELFVGEDGTIDILLFRGTPGVPTGDIEYEHILPKAEERQPYMTTKNTHEARDQFALLFRKEHGEAKPWGKYQVPHFVGLSDHLDTSDSIAEHDKGRVAEYVSGPIGELQLGIIRVGPKIYQVIFGWSDDFEKTATMEE